MRRMVSQLGWLLLIWTLSTGALLLAAELMRLLMRAIGMTG